MNFDKEMEDEEDVSEATIPADDVTPMALPSGDQHMGKRMKVNAEGAQALDVTRLQMSMEVKQRKKM